jgi:hypothetical protein
MSDRDLTALDQARMALPVGTRCRWDGTDSTFEGDVRDVFDKRSGKIMVVLENDHGLIHVYPVTERLRNMT